MSKFRRNRDGMRLSTDYNNNYGNSTERKVSKTKVMPHDEFIKRVKKSLYYGSSQMSIPLSDYMTDCFSETHHGYSLNRLNYETVGQLNATPYSLILALIYLERLKETDPSYTKHITPTELFIVSMLVSTKFYNGYDEDVLLTDWAEYGNLSNDQLKKIELDFLSALNWNLYVSNEEFFHKLKTIETVLAKQQGLHRGWFTYVELNHLLPSITIAKSFIQYSLVLAMSYAAFVTTLAGSVFLASQVPGTSLYAATHPSQPPTIDNAVIHGGSNQTKADSHTQLKTDKEEQESMDETMSLILSENVICSMDRLRDTPHTSDTGSFNYTTNQHHNNYPSTFHRPINIIHDTANIKHEIGIRTGFNLRSFLFGYDHDDNNHRTNNYNNLPATKKRNLTDYKWLMRIDHRDITAELSSCSKMILA